jgi:transcriptional regulator with XRE-family HTH domain
MRSKTVDRLLKTTPEDIKIFVDLYADLTVRINELLREKGITKKELADRLDKSPSEISKWLSGEHNFTLRSLAKLSAELGEPLLEVPKISKTEVVQDGFVYKQHIFTSCQKIEPNTSKKWQFAEPTEPCNELSYANAG